jgi:membrane protease YdiL (CAAX protease family)
VEPPQLRLTLTEAALVFLAAVFGMFAGGGVFYALLGVWALPLIDVLFIAGPVLIAAGGRGSVRLVRSFAGVNRISARETIGAVLVGASFWYLLTRLLLPLLYRHLGGEEASEAIEEALFPDGVQVGVLIAMVAVFPGICEELLFRGALLRALRGRVSAPTAVFLTAALFGLIHIYPAQMVPTFLFGLLLGVMALRTGSVVTSMLAHVIHNGMVTAASLNAWPAGIEFLDANPVATTAGAAVITVIGLLLTLTKTSPS